MKFLCLHGMSTNAQTLRNQVLKTQLSPLIYELGKDKTITFHFLNGPIESAPFPGLASTIPGPFFRYYDGIELDVSDPPPEVLDLPKSTTSPGDFVRGLRRLGLEYEKSQQARDYVQDYADKTEPESYDGIIGFSEGASVAASVLLHQANISHSRPFKCAIFFSGGPPYDADSKKSVLADETDECIDVPSVHVVGSKDPARLASMALYEICNKDSALLVEHHQGHAIPWERATTKFIVEAIKRAIGRANAMEC
ncbi:hypothetical protein P7C71_g4291, partial [Lecanoromycetidae sp. Uapishka_2]